MIAPIYLKRAPHLGAAAATLVVEVEMEVVCEPDEMREQVVVVSARTTMQHNRRGPCADFRDEELPFCAIRQVLPGL